MSKLRQDILISLRPSLVRRIDRIAVDWDEYRKHTIERLLEMAVGGIEQTDLPGGELTANDRN